MHGQPCSILAMYAVAVVLHDSTSFLVCARCTLNDRNDDMQRSELILIASVARVGDSKVILCTLPASSDFATQEAIKISR